MNGACATLEDVVGLQAFGPWKTEAEIVHTILVSNGQTLETSLQLDSCLQQRSFLAQYSTSVQRYVPIHVLLSKRDPGAVSKL